MDRIDRENNLIRINAFDDPRLKLFTDYNEAQLFHYYEPEAGIFIAESPKVIERAIRAGYEPIAMLVEEKALERDLADFDRELGTYTITCLIFRSLSLSLTFCASCQAIICFGAPFVPFEEKSGQVCVNLRLPCPSMPESGS